MDHKTLIILLISANEQSSVVPCIILWDFTIYVVIKQYFMISYIVYSWDFTEYIIDLLLNNILLSQT